jgi:WD40 repeat protein
VTRKVALKVIKAGMDTKEVITRFEAERQALALMDHPNIAKVLDGGATQAGRPYFVMELVRGIPITEYCDQNHLSTGERLQLFIKVCQAVQHAHQKAVIHRDLKPGNILVTLHDGEPVPKVIDFGVAKALGQKLTEKTLFTPFRQMIGTPAYMSPEQAEMSGLDVDTRSDIYSLGVLLYELLTGVTPFDREGLAQAALDEIRRMIRETEPPKPSTRLRTLGDKLADVAKHRRAEPAALSRLVRGDLDWIVMKCLEKDRKRRYETANGLAMDVHRFLHHEIVSAVAPSPVYRLRKLVLRNKVAFGAAAAVALALILGVAVSTVEAVRAKRAESKARASEKTAVKQTQLAQAQRQRADEQAEATRENLYVADMNVAQQALEMNNLRKITQLLDRHRPKGGEKDLRGWEWRYLWKQCQSDALVTLCQYPGRIISLGVSHDAKWVAVGHITEGAGFTISLWDLPNRVHILDLLSGSAPLLAFSPRQALLAFAKADTTSGTNLQFGVSLWDPETRRQVEEIPLGAACGGLAFSQDGHTVVTSTASPDDQITLWQIPGVRKLASFAGSQYVHGIAEGTLFAAARDLSIAAQAMTNRTTFRVTELTTGRELWRAQASQEHITALAFSPDAGLLASGSGYAESAIRLWDVASGKEIGRLEGHRSWVGALVFLPDGKTLASASADQTIRLWDTATLEPVATLRGHKLEVWKLGLLPDGKTLISGSKDGMVCLWNSLTTGMEKLCVRLPMPICGWWFSTDSKSIFTVDCTGSVVSCHGSAFQQREPVLEVGTAYVRTSSDGELLAARSNTGAIQVWSLSQRALLHELPLAAHMTKPQSFLQHNRKLVTFAEDSGVLQEWDLADLKQTGFRQVYRNPWESSVILCAFSPDERWGLVLHGDSAGTLLDRSTGRERQFLGSQAEAVDAAFSPDGTLFAAASQLGFVKIWATATLGEVATLWGFLAGVHSVAFSPDGERLIAGSAAAEALKLWDIHTRQEVLTLKGQGSLFNDTAMSPDGNILGSKNGAGILHLWRAPSFAEIEATEKNQPKSQ